MKNILRMLFMAVFTQAVVMSSAQVTKLANNTNFESGVVLGTNAYLITSNDSIWISNGSPGGTHKFISTVSVDSTSGSVYYLGKIFFGGVNSTYGSELWMSDGTVAGTKMVKDINTGAPGSSPRDFFVYNNKLFFFAKTKTYGVELWISDGTKAGTVLVKNIYPGKGDSYSNSANFFTNNNILYFLASDSTHGQELWKTDGTAPNTTMIKDIYPGTGSSACSGFTPLGTKVIFNANDSVHGAELWVTTGTATSTKMVKDISTAFPGFGSSPSQFLPFKGKIYFAAIDLFTGFELYVTDGTTAGTNIVKDINPGNSSSIPLLINAIVIGTKFYFSANTDSAGTELWSSDGTGPGTVQVKNIRTGSASSNPLIALDYFDGNTADTVHHILFNGKIFLQATDATHGTEFWITNGTAAGTKMVKDIYVGKGSSLSNNNFSYFYSKADLFFAANDSTTGVELWKSDGTSAGTARVANINPGKKSSNPLPIALLNKHLLFTADDGDNANGITDLYSLDQVLDTLAFDGMAAPKINIAPDGSSFYVYPNPAKDQLSVTVNSQADKKASITILSPNGKQLYSQQFNSIKGIADYKINISTLAKGMYFLQLTTDKGTTTVKFIKQ